MAWVYLAIAGLLEVGWAVGLKYTEGLTRLWPTILTAVAILGSMGFLALALRSLPMGAACAVWTGIGTIGTVASAFFSSTNPRTRFGLPVSG